ncbi:hypothetical protein ACD661_00235 [Legionella lytica]|uniref:HTH cro/C1-type domain-containing protein n=1 Tax=Legionella lytica TaxID=96232 RepID=A0ABW8D2P4_9GAMM
MKITVGTLSFDTVQAFTDHLEQTYGQVQIASREVLICLKYEGLEPEHVMQLLDFILDPAHPHTYKLQIASLKNSSTQLVFDDAYLASKRRRLAIDFQPHIAELPQLIRSFPPISFPIRKSKKNWLEGTQGASLNIQIPVEKTSVKVQARQPVATSLRKQREGVVVDGVAPNPSVPMDTLGELVDRETINAKSKRFANRLFKDKAPDLQLLWDRLVGVSTDKAKKITHVHTEAMEQIIRYYPEFTDGVVLNNLPAGFSLQTTNEDGLVLCYSSELEKQHLDTITPLTIVPEVLDPTVNGSFEQFTLLAENLANRARYETEFSHLFAPKIAKETRLNALNFFLAELEPNPLNLRRIHNLFKFLPLTTLHYHGLAYVLTNAGVDGLVLVLQQFKTLHEQELFNDLHHLFLENPDSYAELATLKGIENLKKLAELSPEQYTWWCSLVNQHKASGARTNFNELFDAYSYFLTELGELARDLPASCPLINAKHMKPALDRALFIIKNSADPKEQLAHLWGLDFTADYEQDYRIVSHHMKLVPGEVNAVAFKNSRELCTFFAGEHSAEEARTQFYRFIGIQDWAYGLTVYEDIEIQLNAKYGHLGPEVSSVLRGIILLTTTGKRSCTEEGDPGPAVQNLIDKMIAVAKIITPEADVKTGLMPILLMCQGTLGAYEQEHMPSLHELNALFDTLLLKHGSAIEIPESEKANYIPLISENNVHAHNEALRALLDELAPAVVEPQDESAVTADARVNLLALMTFSLNSLHAYGALGASFIDSYQIRLNLEQSKTTEINSFNINVLLRHLHPTAKLGRHLAECFAEEPNILPQFMMLLSLISDEIPAYNDAAEVADSEFETQVKILAQNILALSEEQRTLFFTQLTDIDIETSYRLPSLENLLQIVQAISVEPEELRILNIIQDALPNTIIGSSDVMELKKPDRIEDYDAHLTAAINSLQTANSDFDDYLLSLIPYDSDNFDDEFEPDLSTSFDDLAQIINALIYLKNNNPNEFRRCVSRLANELTSSSQRCTFTSAQLGNLLKGFSEIAKDNVVAQLDILLNAMQSTSDYSEEQFDNAIEQVANLMQYHIAGVIDFASYMKLLKLSFVHTLSVITLFPFEQLIKIYELFPSQSTQADALFDAWMELFKKINVEQVDSVFLERIITQTLYVLDVFPASDSTILPLMTSLIKACTPGPAAELQQYEALLDEFIEKIKSPILNAWIKILSAYGQNVTDDKLPLLFKLHEGLQIQEFNLAEMTALFDSPPYPDLEQFIGVLNGSVREFKTYIEQFDKDPKKGRAAQYDAEFGITVTKTAEQVLQEQFDTSQVARVVAEVRNMLGDVDLTAQEQYELAQQITYINAIGKEAPLEIKGLGIHKDLTTLSRADLRRASDYLIATIRQPNSSSADKLKAQLNLLAVLREQYERATGQIIYAPQLAAVLQSLKNERGNLLMQIASEHDVRVTNALLAVMQWIYADGGTVNLCYASREHVTHDYYDRGHKDFFTSVGIDSSCLKADSAWGTYKKGGINCSTMGDLALYRQCAKQRQESLIAEKDGHSLSTNLILCGTDLSALNDKQSFSLTANEADEHPDAWIYPLVNEFINLPQFKNLTKSNAWSQRQDFTQLRVFLEQHASTGSQRAKLKNTSNEQLSVWMDSAVAAQRMVEGVEFEVLHKEANIYMAVPYSLMAAQQGMSIAQEVQQFLHARLEKEYVALELKFPLNPVRSTLAQASVKDFIDDHKAEGRIIGLSKTMNSDKLRGLCEQLNVTAVNAIPTCLPVQNELVVTPTKHEEQYCQLIQNVMANAVNGQPIVLIAQDENEVRYLQEMLTAHYGPARPIGVLDIENRQSWLRTAGKLNTVTITTAASLGRGTSFNTDLSEGFLTIQTYLDSPNHIREFLRRISTYEKPGKYTAIYESQELLRARSWSYYDNAERELMFENLDLLRHKQQEVTAMQRHYNQTAGELCDVAMQQFDGWQAFLYSVYSKDECLQLSNELLVLKDNLARALSEKWQECLSPLGRPELYLNAYERQDPMGQNVLLSGFQKALLQFEHATVAIWKNTCAALQDKAAKVVELDSLDEMRCNYLAEVSLSEQFRLHEIEERKQANVTRVAKEQAQRYVVAGLDVNGAMMRYSDGTLDTYKAAFTKNRVKSFQQHISQIIATETVLRKSIRDNLLRQINYCDTLKDLILFLNSYETWFDENDFERKYAMQPVIQELLEVVQQVGYPEDVDLAYLKDTYINDVVKEIAETLEHSLSWSVKGRRGLGYLLERTAVTDAANDILTAVAALRASLTPEQRQAAIKNLYRILMQHQARLDGLWIFPLGHKNTRDLIQETLATLDGLTLIGNGEKTLDKSFIQESKEQAVYMVMRDKFHLALSRLERENTLLRGDRSWGLIKSQLLEIQRNNDSVYSLYEMNELIVNKINKLDNAGADAWLLAPLTHLRGELNKMWHECEQHHQELMDESKYFKLKASKIKAQLTGKNNFHVKDVSLKSGHNGFSDYLDLVIEGSGVNSALNGFLRYNSQIPVLKKTQREYERQFAKALDLSEQLAQLKKEQLPLLSYKAVKPADSKLFPAQFQARVDAILQLNAYVKGETPEDLSGFSAPMQAFFQDRARIKNFTLATLDLDEIEQIQDEDVKLDLIGLYERAAEAAKPRSIWKSAFSAVVSIVRYQESEEDREELLEELKKHCQTQVQKNLLLTIKKQQDALASALEDFEQKTLSEVNTLNEKLEFLAQKINQEEAKGGIYCKRFKSVAEFYQFEAQFQSHLASQIQQQIDTRRQYEAELFLDDEELEFDNPFLGMS